MNKERRRAIDALIKRIEDFDTSTALSIAEIKQEAETLAETIQELVDEEQEYKDNMPESFQDGEKGNAADEAIAALEAAKEAMDELIEDHFGFEEGAVNSVTEQLDEAKA